MGLQRSLISTLSSAEDGPSIATSWLEVAGSTPCHPVLGWCHLEWFYAEEEEALTALLSGNELGIKSKIGRMRGKY